MRGFLANSIATITGTSRYFPEFEWSKELWTHNIFRFFGMIFGEQYCVAPSTAIFTDGKQVAYSLEGQLALIEAVVRTVLKRNFSYKLVLIPQLQLAGYSHGEVLPYRFAIAFDSDAGQGNNNNPLSLTISGSDNLLYVWTLGDLTDTLTDIQWNGGSMTFVQKIQYPADRWTYNYILETPTTGTHNVATIGNTFSAIAAISYTGCSQTGQPDGNNTHALLIAGTTNSITWTITASNCWVVGYNYGFGSNASTNIGSIRVSGASGATTIDSDGTVASGSTTLTFTSNIGSQQCAGGGLSISPVAGTTVYNGFFVQMLQS